MQGTKTVTVLVVVGTGSKYETKKNNGISHFLEHMFFKGTKRRPRTLDISGELDSIGAEFNAFTGKEYTGYWVKADKTKIFTALDVVSDMLLNSQISSKEIEREKGVIIEEYNMYEDNPMLSIEDVFEALLYGDTPAGWDTIGTKQNILNFKRKDFTDYLNSQYGAKSTFVCLAGNIGNDQKSLEKKVLKYFSDNKLDKRDKLFKEKIAVKESQEKPALKVKYKKTDQAHLVLGVRAYSYSHKDVLIVKLMAIILGGSMSSRLFINLRERQGLAYYVRANNEVYSDVGYLSARAGVQKDKIKQAIKIILSEYKKLTTVLVPKEEINRAKDLLRGRSAIQFELSDNLASFYTRQAVLLHTVKRTQGKVKDKISTPEEYIKDIQAITTADIKRVAKNIFVNKGLNLAIIGPFKQEKEFKGLLKF